MGEQKNGSCEVYCCKMMEDLGTRDVGVFQRHLTKVASRTNDCSSFPLLPCYICFLKISQNMMEDFYRGT